MVYKADAIHLYSWGFVRKKNPRFMALNVNHAANSSVNYHWERKQACTLKKANSCMRKPRACLLRMTPRGKEANRNKKRKKNVLKVTPLELFYIKDGRQEENTLWLWFVYHTDRNNRVFFFSPNQV